MVQRSLSKVVGDLQLDQKITSSEAIFRVWMKGKARVRHR